MHTGHRASDTSHKADGMAENSSPQAASGSTARQQWLRVFLLVAFIGWCGAALGLLYGVLLVSVPSPDPTPEMASRESHHLTVSSGMPLTGCGLILYAPWELRMVW